MNHRTKLLAALLLLPLAVAPTCYFLLRLPQPPEPRFAIPIVLLAALLLTLRWLRPREPVPLRRDQPPRPPISLRLVKEMGMRQTQSQRLPPLVEEVQQVFGAMSLVALLLLTLAGLHFLLFQEINLLSVYDALVLWGKLIMVVWIFPQVSLLPNLILSPNRAMMFGMITWLVVFGALVWSL